MKRVLQFFCLALVILMMLGHVLPAQAASYSFPYAGVALDALPEWTVLTPETLDGMQAEIAAMGADVETLRADYAVMHTVFEIYLPGGAQVSLSAVQTEDSLLWSDMVHMQEAEKQALFDAFTHAPYEDAAWAQGMPGFLQYAWSANAGSRDVQFCGLVTVRQGMFYTLTASGFDLPTAELHEANAQVLAQMRFLGSAALETAEQSPNIALPAAIEDNGIVTPLAVMDFNGITYDEMTTITIRTLPGAEVLLKTATDQLRGRADEAGLSSFQVSTKRETVYTYTVTAQAEGRSPSAIDISVQRQLDDEAKAAAYRKTARDISIIGYSNFAANPSAYVGDALSFRGRVGEVGDALGFPCVLVYTENPGRGVWRSPVWVVLTDAITLQVEDICSVYGDIRGDTMPYTDEEGQTQQAPVVIGQSILQ